MLVRLEGLVHTTLDESVVCHLQVMPSTLCELADPDVAITIPSIEEVGAEEELEKVGEVMSVLSNVVVVRGSATAATMDNRALDAETLLVFGDRKVLGYVSFIF